MFGKLDVRRKSIAILALSYDNRKIVVRYFVNRAPVLGPKSVDVPDGISINSTIFAIFAGLMLVANSSTHRQTTLHKQCSNRPYCGAVYPKQPLLARI